MKCILLTTALSLSLLATASAFASAGYVRGNVGMYAGPDEGYPSVFMLSAGTPVVIEGCIDGWAWCDVNVGYNRGWVPGSYLQEEYGGQLVLVPAYGVQIGIPIVAFVFGTYWDNYYRNRPWYGERTRWNNFRPQYRSASGQGGSYGNVGRGSYGHSPAVATNVSHARVSGSPAQHSVAATPTPHTARSSAALAPQYSRASPVRSQPAAVSRGPTAQSHVSAPKATQRAASARVVSKRGGEQDEAKH
jgi:uncharacterized protein YraI